MAKNIVFCADGTWNNPNEDQDDDHQADPTNVFKLFLHLDGRSSPLSLREADEQEKELVEGGVSRQVAKYIHGVGDSRNPIRRIIGGAFGAGMISRIVRGYTFISRNYEAGDDIYIVGFSRGAYTARALAGLIASQGVLTPENTGDKEIAYRRGAQVWYRYRKAALEKVKARGRLARLAEIASDLPAFLSRGNVKDDDLLPVDHIAAVGVWDTVGSLGIPNYVGGGQADRVDAFRFADLKLSAKVTRGFHAVAIDEQRDDFQPTLWEDSPAARQVLFAGAHADIGGGYPLAHESGLSDIALRWMIERLGESGVRFAKTPMIAFEPDPLATAHMPWLHLPWSVPPFMSSARTFPAGMEMDPSVTERMAAAMVFADAGGRGGPYKPGNLP